MAISRAQALKELLPGLNALFGLTYSQYDDLYKEVFEVDTSDRSFEEETKLAGFGTAPVKPEGQAIQYDTAQEAWTARYVHDTIALGFAITEEAMEDNLYENIAKRYTKALARSMAHTKNIKAFNILNLGFAGGSNPTYGDGKTLLATDHPLTNGSTISNRAATGVDLNETSLEAALIQISQWTDERGLLIQAKGKKLVVPPQYNYIAQRLLFSDLRVGTSDNDLNAVKKMGAVPGGYVVSPWLTDTNSWFLLTDVPDGLKLFQRVNLKTSLDGDFDTGNVRYKARERYSIGCSDPLGIWGSPGST